MSNEDAKIINEINLEHDVLLQNINNQAYLIEKFQKQFELVKTQNVLRTKYLTVAALNTIVDILDYYILKLKSRLDHLALLDTIYKSLRNSLVNGVETQNLVFNNVRLMSLTGELLNCLLGCDEAETNTSLSFVLQFLCNLIVANASAQVYVWGDFKLNILKSLLRFKVAHISVMIIYNISKEHESLLPKDTEFVCNVMLLMSKNIDNLEFLFELLLQKNVITDRYVDLDSDTRILLLDHLRILSIADSIDFPNELISLLVKQFKTKSDCILKTVDHYLDSIEPIEVSQLLDLISSVSSKENYMPVLQNDKSLVINVAFLLKSIHEFGKLGNNNFSAIQKLSELTNKNSEVQDHPGFGFKASLIRLLGNLCWTHRDNQDLVRELDCIPLLMDCCNMDARNPLIIQWVILAIRNVCDKNDVNQGLIANMSKIGVVDSNIIREMGLTLSQDGDSKIGIAPLRLTK